jgi:hypothetical protein
MASQQDLLANLQALTQQAQGGVPRMVAPTSRTNGPTSSSKRSSGYPDITEGSTGVFDASSIKTRQQQSKLNTSARVASSRYPDITEQVASAKAGQQKPSGALGVVAGLLDNPIAKTVLAPLAVLDYGRRGIISGVREIADIVDTDKETKASIGDWFKQTKDPTYGFGTAFPIPGKLGRVIGLVGKVLEECETCFNVVQRPMIGNFVKSAKISQRVEFVIWCFGVNRPCKFKSAKSCG